MVVNKLYVNGDHKIWIVIVPTFITVAMLVANDTRAAKQFVVIEVSVSIEPIVGLIRRDQVIIIIAKISGYLRCRIIFITEF